MLRIARFTGQKASVTEKKRTRATRRPWLKKTAAGLRVSRRLGTARRRSYMPPWILLRSFGSRARAHRFARSAPFVGVSVSSSSRPRQDIGDIPYQVCLGGIELLANLKGVSRLVFVVSHLAPTASFQGEEVPTADRNAMPFPVSHGMP